MVIRNHLTNKLVTTSIPPTPPTVDKPELKLYNIQLHKLTQTEMLCRCCILPGDDYLQSPTLRWRRHDRNLLLNTCNLTDLKQK